MGRHADRRSRRRVRRGFVGRAFGSDPNEEFWSFSTWFWAFIGSLVVLFIWGLIAGRRAKA
ncbi:GlsB/YeaQ/YmgE family stress response membrane protein [Oerskovia sp. M15]